MCQFAARFEPGNIFSLKQCQLTGATCADSKIPCFPLHRALAYWTGNLPPKEVTIEELETIMRVGEAIPYHIRGEFRPMKGEVANGIVVIKRGHRKGVPHTEARKAKIRATQLARHRARGQEALA